MTYHPYRKGCDIYLLHFIYSAENNCFLLEQILKEAEKEEEKAQLGDNVYCEAAYFPCSEKAVAVNNYDQFQHLKNYFGSSVTEVNLKPWGSSTTAIEQ